VAGAGGVGVARVEVEDQAVGRDERVLVLAPPGFVADAADGVAVVDDVAVLVET
jgi:hypothetical protein